ncbi:TetR/AcrR family transcriptional regulator [Jiulongibacter sediminis]|uniref:TetR/AcrR family transcriptional regulator n=1 Tax=Jiulongibacter sediminis TaxID=1605367 RepID=UPI0026EE7CCE|nr:TetR/AcrR family transcriptional regulator [Jiulongibacter sediminis]
MPKIVATKEDWIKLGFQMFSDEGLSGIVIEAMAKKLKINKSSFYWHFSTKAAFIEEIINHWERVNTSKIIELVNNEPTPEARFEKLLELSFLKDSHIDFFFYLKKYARSSKALEALIESLDNERIAFTAGLLQQLGFSAAEASLKASIFYKYLIGYHEVIRYKEQSPTYLITVKNEIKEFINI